MIVPQYNWSNETKKKNDKIKKCILVQNKFHAQLNSVDVLELENIDRKIDWLGSVTM